MKHKKRSTGNVSLPGDSKPNVTVRSGLKSGPVFCFGNPDDYRVNSDGTIEILTQNAVLRVHRLFKGRLYDAQHMVLNIGSDPESLKLWISDN
jgi:hypothetical protein